MTEGEVVSAQRKLKPILWPKLVVSREQEAREVVFPANLSLEKAAANERAEKEVIQFFNKSTAMMADVLSLPELKELEIETPEKIMSANQESMASFGVDDEDFAHIKFSKQYLDIIVSNVSDLLDGKKLPDDIVKTGGKEPEKIKYMIKTGGAISLCIHALAHEMYHARQALQDPDYYDETLREGTKSEALRNMSKEKDDVWERMGLRIYYDSRGERGANGFATRFLKEFKKKIMLIDDQDRSIVEKLFLSGVDPVVEDLVGEIKERYQKKPDSSSGEPTKD